MNIAQTMADLEAARARSEELSKESNEKLASTDKAKAESLMTAELLDAEAECDPTPEGKAARLALVKEWQIPWLN